MDFIMGNPPSFGFHNAARTSESGNPETIMHSVHLWVRRLGDQLACPEDDILPYQILGVSSLLGLAGDHSQKSP